MTGKWTASSFSSNSTPISIDESLMKDEVVILLQGKNRFGDAIFSYVKLNLEKLIEMKRSMLRGQDFMPSDFGSVLAAGRGEPSVELRSEMAVRYKMIDKPVNTAPAPQEKPKLPSFAVKYSPNYGDE